MNKPIGVKLLNKYIKTELNQDPILRNIFVVGEVTNLHINKYTYFDLKEDDELINCIYFDNDLSFEDGDSLVIRGSINVYTKASRYQINVKKAEIVGQGQAFFNLKLLKEKLYKKGYFDLANKKNIPLFPKTIGLITSEKSAAIVDFISIIKANYPIADIYLYSTGVQGQKAKYSIVKALKSLDLKSLDLIVLTRGGGSSEDLSVFNDEDIANTIFYANTPIISAVGHEIDTTIADLVSDLRVSTPTKAAEYIISPFIESKSLIENLHFDIKDNIVNKLEKNYYLLNISNLEIEKYSPSYFIEKNLQNILDIKNNNYDYLIKNIYKKHEEINLLKSSIEEDINRILHENMMKILDVDKDLVDVNNLQLNQVYLMANDKVTYKIKILEKFNG